MKQVQFKDVPVGAKFHDTEGRVIVFQRRFEKIAPTTVPNYPDEISEARNLYFPEGDGYVSGEYGFKPDEMVAIFEEAAT